MKKENNPIQELLNQIYNEPDLGEKIFEFINPHIVNAYGLLELDSYNKKNDQPRIFQSEIDLNNLTTILYRELPGIFNIYTKLPLQYRNTAKLKTGKTHRETLLDNMMSLTKSMVAIEHLQYEEIDKEAIVKTKLLNNKYSQYNDVSVKETLEDKDIISQSELQLEDDFNYEVFKKTLNPEDFEVKEYTNLQDKKPANIEFKNGLIEHKIAVKDKMKAFMKGVYQAGSQFVTNEKYAHKTKRVLKIVTAPVYYPLVGAKIYVRASLQDFGSLMLGTFGVAVSGMFIMATIGTINSRTGYELLNTKEYANAESIGMKEINISLLNEYVKKMPNWKLSYGNNEGKEIAIFDIKIPSKKCEATANKLSDVLNKDYIEKNTFSNYKINNIELPLNKELKPEMVNKICALPENNIHMEMNLTKYPKETTKPKL